MQLAAVLHLMRKTLRQSSGGHLRAHWVRMKVSAASASYVHDMLGDMLLPMTTA